MRIEWALPCRYAESLQDGTATLVGAALDTVWVPELPEDVSVSVMVRVVGPPDEFESQHRLEMRLITPDGTEQQALGVEFGSLPRPALLEPGMEAGLFLPVSIRWRAEEHGLCTIELYLDGHRQRSLPILLREPA